MRKLLFLLTFAVSTSLAQEPLELVSRWTTSRLDTALAKDSMSNKFNEVWGFAWQGGEYAVIGSAYGIHFIDVSYAEYPTERAYVQLSDTGVIWRDFKHKGHYLYCVADGSLSNKLAIIDFSQLPLRVELVYHSNALSETAHNLFIDGDKLYLFGNIRNKERLYVDVLSIAEPTKPSFLVNLPDLLFGSTDYTHDGFVRNDTGYFCAGRGGFFCYDLSNLNQPMPIFTLVGYPGAGYNHSCWLNDKGDKLVFAEELPRGLPLRLLDLNQVSKPRLSQSFNGEAGVTPHNPFYLGEEIYSSMYEYGVGVFAPDSLGNYRLAYYYDTYPQNDSAFAKGSADAKYTGYLGNWGVYPFLPSGLILASDISNGLFLLKKPGTVLYPPSYFDSPYFFPDASKPFPMPNTAEGIPFPNPANRYLNMSLPDLGGQTLYYAVHDVAGKQVESGHTEGPVFQLNVAHYLEGVYYLRIKAPGLDGSWVFAVRH